MASETNLIKRVNAMSCGIILENCKDMFIGLGCLKKKCNLWLEENCQPVIDILRRLSFSLHKPLREEIEEMLKLKVIVKVVAMV